MERERSALQHITSTAVEGAIPPRALERSSTPKEWEELVGWVLESLLGCLLGKPVGWLLGVLNGMLLLH